MTKSLQISIVLLMFLSACSLQKKADDMAQTSNDIHQDTKHVADGMASTKRGLSEAESAIFTKPMFDSLFGIKIVPGTKEAMDNDEAEMVGEAGAIMKALYFQFWGAGYQEDIDQLDIQASTSIEWMFSQIRDYIARSFRADGLMNSYLPDRNYKALASLASFLDQTSPDFKNSLKQAGLPQDLSLYTLIVDALKQCGNVDPKYKFPRTVDQVCAFKPDWIYMLQLRQNYMPMLMFSESTDFSDQWNITRLWTLKVSGSTLDLGSDDVTPQSLAKWTYWLKGAKQTRADLVSLCRAPQYNSSFFEYIKDLKIGDRSSPLFKPSNPMGKARTEFANALESVQNQEELQMFNSHCGR